MSIIVDYRCTSCGSIGEAYVDSPAPSQRACDACGGESRRRWSPVGIISRRSDASAATEKPGRAKPPGASLCAQNPDVPGLCHMSPSAGRAWVARARGDNRALDAELARQEAAATVKTPTLADAISHEHTH